LARLRFINTFPVNKQFALHTIPGSSSRSHFSDRLF
jgi:hypothetical protein